MDNIPTIATGLVKPKTTALFFDKLWVPEVESQYYGIPDSFRFRDSDFIEKQFESLYVNAAISNLDIKVYSDEFGMEYYHDSNGRKHYIIKDGIERYYKIIHGLEDRNAYFTTFNRNEVIRIVSNYYYRRSIGITPIFINQTEFEKSLLMGKDTIISSNDSLYEHIRAARINNSQVNNIPAKKYLVATITNIPTVIEENLSWEQVKEIRKDKKSWEKLKRFNRWASQNLSGKSPKEVSEIINYELEDYKHALHKHGVMTAWGGFSSLLSTGSTIAGFVGSTFTTIALGSVVIAVCLGYFAAHQLYDYIDIQKTGVAYLYDVYKRSTTDIRA